jgi:hypothetical protein
VTAAEISDLVEEGALLDAAIKDKALRLKTIKALLIPLGPGEYLSSSSGRKAIVIQPERALKPTAAAIASARPIAGTAFSKLFERVVAWKTQDAKTFRQVALALLTPAKAQRIIALCEVDNPAYVIFA